MIKLYTDAAVNQQSGNAAIGILIVEDGQQHQIKNKILAANNHEAEFKAAVEGFKTLISLNIPQTTLIFYYTDSKIVIDSLNKQYAKHFASQIEQLLALQNHFDTVINTWIPDHQNQGAHHLAIQALHAE